MSDKPLIIFKWICGTVAVVAGICVFGYTLTDENRKKLKMAQIEKDYPSEYWIAKAAEENASVEIARLEQESNERLEIDRRERLAIENDKIRAFEATAPEGYWNAKIEKEKSDAMIAVAKKNSETQLQIARESNSTNERIARENRWAQESSDSTQQKIAESSNKANAEIMKTAFDGMLNMANSKS